jgi:UDP-3-O-[3-hydroxymyristoyl] N-acetylglucosamine deacetylase/3-hydroxyacyl-[acyl-carrier-protein] dehydratase
LQGHYPGNPVMPGVLQVEAMAQAAGILMIRRSTMEGKTALFMSCDKVKWRKPVRPGDQLLIKVKLTKVRGTIACAEGECSVNGQVVCSADLMFATVDSSALD